MKIFISHSSENKLFGEKLVELLRNIGLKESEIVFTSNVAYGIPVGENIFNWLKSQISENPFVIYLLSEEYYKSIACLNEMGAAWIIESKHAAIFMPNFNIESKEFQKGALNPREIGFYINDEYRIISFIQVLSNDFEITNNIPLITQSVKKFIKEIESIENIKPIEIQSFETKSIKIDLMSGNAHDEIKEQTKIITGGHFKGKEELYNNFLSLIYSQKLKDDELILLQFLIGTGRNKLKIGWQEDVEISNIKEWEKINDINNKLSNNYQGVVNRFSLRGFTEVSAVTGGGNPKEVKIKDEISKHLLELPQEIEGIIDAAIKRNFLEYLEDDYEFPF